MNILKHYFSTVNTNRNILINNNQINQLDIYSKEKDDGYKKKTLLELFEESFLKMIEQDEKQEEIQKIKLQMIPTDLQNEVFFIIDKQFKENAEAYLKSVDLYFQTFTLDNLTKCNIKDSELYEQSTAKERRVLNRLRKENLWHASVLLKLVGKKRAKYACNTIQTEFKQAKQKEKEFVENCKLVGKNRKVFELKNCMRTSEQSIAEKLNLLSVQEKIATEKNWTWAFITLTLAGEYHPNPKKGKNTYNGVSPRASAKMLNENIKRVRALMHKADIKAGRDYVGCSSAEAHEDACLHKHLLIFCDASMMQEIRICFEYHFPNLNDKSFRVESEENKAKPFKTENEAYVKGKFREHAASYVFKYVMKSITSYNLDVDFKDMSKADKNAVLNNAFRSYNFIRGFSFFGIENCLTKFRFIARNLKDMNLPVEISSLVETNNLYELLSKGFFDMFENVYVKEESKGRKFVDVMGQIKTQEKGKESRMFVGCKFNGKMYLKRFFQLIRNASEKLSRTEIAIKFLIMKIREKEIRDLLGLVILNHNYSRERQNTAQSALISTS